MKVLIPLLVATVLFIVNIQGHIPQRILAGETIATPKAESSLKINIDASISQHDQKNQGLIDQSNDLSDFEKARLRAVSEPDAINLNDFSDVIEAKFTKTFSRALNKEEEKTVKTQSDAQNTQKYNAAGEIIGSNDHKEELCNKNLIEALGMDEIKDDKPQQMDRAQNEFCPKNKKSCCTTEHLKKIKPRFYEAQKKLNWKIDLIEDIFNLFRGKIPISKIFRLTESINEDKGKCQESLNRDIDEFFTSSYISMQIDEMNSLIALLPIFRKNQVWFYGNLICTACNPHETRHFKITNDGSSMMLDMRTCTDMMNTRTFEARVMRLFYDFLVPLTKFIDCSEDKNEFEIETEFFNENIVKQFEQDFNNCSNNFKTDSPACQTMCFKKLHVYDFPGDIFEISYKVLKVLYKSFTNMEIADFYVLAKKEITEEEFSIPYAFFSEDTTAFKNYKIAAISWNLNNDGANIYFNHISKDFYEKNWAGVIGAWAVLSLIWLMISA